LVKALGLILSCFLIGWIGWHLTQPAQPSLSTAVFTGDGSAIVFSMAEGEKCFLYRADIATGVARRVTHAASGCEFDPAFSEDGGKLAFMRSPGNDRHAALIIANADGSGEKEIVPAEADNLQPVFVPRSDLILFLRSGAFEHHSPIVASHRHKFDLFAVDAGSGKVSQLTHSQFYEISHVSASADGKQFLLTVFEEGSHFLMREIYNPQTPPVSLQPAVPQGDASPVEYNAVWLPDGKRILFQAALTPPGGGDFDYNIYQYTLATRATERLTKLSGMLDGFSVSADGSRAVLLHKGQYLLLDLATRQVKPLRWHLQ
jgi:Tol biopolymer transport system component